MKSDKLLDRWLFEQTFSKLTASPRMIQEVINMTETKRRPKKFILRRLVIAALVMALAFALAMGANAASNGELFKSVMTFVSYTDDGMAIEVSIDTDALENACEAGATVFSIEDDVNGDGRAKIFYKDRDGNYVTEEFDLPEDVQNALDKIETEAAAPSAADIA